MGSDIPAGFLRQRFGFTHLPDFQPELWDEESDLPLGLDRSLSLHGGDIDAQAVEAFRANRDRLPGGDAVMVGSKGISRARIWPGAPLSTTRPTASA